MSIPNVAEPNAGLAKNGLPVAGWRPTRLMMRFPWLYSKATASALFTLRVMARRMPGVLSRLSYLSERFAFASRMLLTQAEVRNTGGSRPNATAALGADFFLDLAKQPIGSETGEVLRLLDRHKLLSDHMFLLYLNQLFADRHIGALDALVRDETLGRDGVRLYYAARLAHYRGEIGPSTQALVHLLADDSGLLPTAQILNLILEQLVRSGDGEGLSAFLHDQRDLCLNYANEPTLIGCLRFLFEDGHKSQAENLLRARLRALPRLLRYYYTELIWLMFPDGLAGSDIGEPCDWRTLMDRFRRDAKRHGLARLDKIERCLLEPLARVPEGPNDLLDLRFDAAAADRLMAVISERLSSAQPCALIRLGDGEAYAFDHRKLDLGPVQHFVADNRVRERHWWSEELGADQHRAIARDVQAAIREADILGVPSIYRVIRDVTGNRREFGTLAAHRGLAVVMSQLGRGIGVDNPIITEERCHQRILHTTNLRRLTSEARRVVVVSCWPQAWLSQWLECPVDWIQVAPHTKVSGATQAAHLPVLPHTYGAVRAELRKRVEPGVLVLVGAGVIGKIFVADARRAGGVALDVGSMLDYGVGYKTRGFADMI